MEGRFVLAIKHNIFRLHRIHKQAAADAFCEQPNSQTRCSEQCRRTHDTYIHHSVLHAGLWSNIRIITPLIRVRKSNQKRLVCQVNSLTHNMIRLRLIGKHVLYRVLDIRGKTAFTCSGKTICDMRIKPYTTSRHEHLVVRQTVIHANRFAVIEHLNSFRRIHRNMQMTSKTVSATHRNNTQCRFCIPQTTCHFVHCSVTTNCHHGFKTHHSKLTSQLRRMTRILRKHNVRQPLFMV